MPVEPIRLDYPIELQNEASGAVTRVEQLDLRDMEAGDIFDASRQQIANASQAELEIRVAAICADQPFAVLRRLRGADLLKIQNWWRLQWSPPKPARPGEDDDGTEGDGVADDPSRAGARSPAS